MDQTDEQAAPAVAAPPRADQPLLLPPPDHPVVDRQAAPPRRHWLRWLILVLVVLALLWLAWRLFGPRSAAPAHAAAAQPVGVAKVGTADMNVVLTGLGTVTPLATVTVQTQISGQLLAVGYHEGQMVKQGDLLAEIDPRPYQVTLQQAQGALAHDTALLAQARSDLARYATLNRQDSIARQQVADQEFLVQQDQGLVIEDQASIASSQLNLTYCRITAPVSGRVGLRLVDPGNFVQTSGSTGLVVITQLQPISVIFVLPEDDVPEVEQQMQAGHTLPLAAYDRTNATVLGNGTLLTTDNTVDTTTGTVKLRAIFVNDPQTLFPNQFVNARLLLKTLPQVTEAPTAAIQTGAPGSFVYLVKPDSTVAVQVVKTGVVDGDNTQITSGLNPGDTVVVDGADTLKAGAKVKITPDASDAAATQEPGPGAPPGQQPNNATPAPGKRAHHRKPSGQPSP
jgi:multidrug efflux system membrane fusion protein